MRFRLAAAFSTGVALTVVFVLLMGPYDFLTKVIISHLHTDHWGDLPGLWAGGWTAGRTIPLEVWGPSGRWQGGGMSTPRRRT